MVSFSPHPYQALVISPLYNKHVRACEVILWFWYIFPWWLVMLSNLSAYPMIICKPSLKICLVCPFSFWKKNYYYVLFLVAWFSLYFFINPLSHLWFVSIFLLSVICSFVFLLTLFTVQKCFLFVVVPQVYFCFGCHAFAVMLKKIFISNPVIIESCLCLGVYIFRFYK